ncbi:hypothetical protein EJ08DRAFT_666857 [Tothia fuscella]|uniref:BZIP domain-containing protein n=1 Tax=Tothia fuscella TaxID=1048955 RepID=A0A9P4NDU3_9PEZI|nr:hypothetical protein EJ08DRAFT_666857 [Tothia fuscella]
MAGRPGHGLALPPPGRRESGTTAGSERRPSRSFGVHSILNPPQLDNADRPYQRRASAQVDEELRQEFFPPGSIAPMSRPPSSSSVGTDETSRSGGARIIRRILTPISPGLHRTASFSRIATGTIDAHESPFLSPASSRIHTQEPGTGGISPLPAIHTAQRSPFTMPNAPTPPLAPPATSRHASVSVIHSSRPSPSPSYSSFSQSGQASPAHQSLASGSGLGPTPPGSYHLARSPVAGSLRDVPQTPLDTEQQDYVPMVSSGQNYQLLTIDTTRGQTQLPVEVQAASRMADEKRKRNAGASARFRARRKAKEVEASSKIANLEQDLQFAIDDSEHYKRERDYLVEVIRTVPHYERYLRERPQSPRIGRVRHRHVSEGFVSTGEDSPAPTSALPSGMERYERFERFESPHARVERIDAPEAGEPPATRRRTDKFQFASPTRAGPPSVGPSPFPTFSSQQSNQRPEPQFRSPVPGPLPPSSTRPLSGSEQHYRTDQPYGRSWPPH